MENLQRRIIKFWAAGCSRESQLNSVRHLGCHAVERQSGDEAEHPMGNPLGNSHEIGLAERRQAAQSKDPTRVLFKFTRVTHGVKRARMNASGERFGSSKRSAVFFKNLSGVDRRVWHIWSG